MTKQRPKLPDPQHCACCPKLIIVGSLGFSTAQLRIPKQAGHLEFAYQPTLDGADPSTRLRRLSVKHGSPRMPKPQVNLPCIADAMTDWARPLLDVAPIQWLFETRYFKGDAPFLTKRSREAVMNWAQHSSQSSVNEWGGPIALRTSYWQALVVPSANYGRPKRRQCSVLPRAPGQGRRQDRLVGPTKSS